MKASRVLAAVAMLLPLLLGMAAFMRVFQRSASSSARAIQKRVPVLLKIAHAVAHGMRVFAEDERPALVTRAEATRPSSWIYVDEIIVR